MTNPAVRIFRYEVPVDDRVHEIELWGDPLFVACNRRDDVVEFWAYSVDGAATSVRRFLVVGTGHPLPADMVAYRGTAPCGPLVWHLVELAPAAALPSGGVTALAQPPG